MDRLRIYVDFVLPARAMELLREGTRGHELLFPPAPATSVLAKPERDPQFLTAHVAFGQPDTECIAEARELKWVHISTSGITRYDTPEFRAIAARKGIPVTNSASVYAEACAAHALSFMLGQARNLPRGLSTRTSNVTEEWHELRETSSVLRGESVLIVGYGAIGKRLAELLRPFEVDLAGYRRRIRGDEEVRMVQAEALHEALGRQDHVVNILPQSPETFHFFEARRFAAMKTGAVFYNIGRGSTVDQDALAEALRARRLRAAWLDVTDPEPLPDNHRLLKEPNCHITPHIAGGHRGEALTQVRHFLGNLERFVRGQPLRDRVM